MNKMSALLFKKKKKKDPRKLLAPSSMWTQREGNYEAESGLSPDTDS